MIEPGERYFVDSGMPYVVRGSDARAFAFDVPGGRDIGFHDDGREVDRATFDDFARRSQASQAAA